MKMKGFYESIWTVSVIIYLNLLEYTGDATPHPSFGWNPVYAVTSLYNTLYLCEGHGAACYLYFYLNSIQDLFSFFL